MPNLLRTVMYGLGIWGFLAAISLIILPLEKELPALQESIKQLVLVGATLWFTGRYMQRFGQINAKQGLMVGLVWLVPILVLDLVLFALGLFPISLAKYFIDVASSYAIIPLITTLTVTFFTLRRQSS